MWLWNLFSGFVPLGVNIYNFILNVMMIFCSTGMFWKMFQTEQKEQLPDYYMKGFTFQQRNDR